MNRLQFDSIVRETIDSINKLLVVKGGEYASDEDRLANFKRGAQLTGVPPLTVAMIYMSKHYDAVASYVRNPARAASEPIEGRFDDLINYCILMKALIEEKGKSGIDDDLQTTLERINHNRGSTMNARDDLSK